MPTYEYRCRICSHQFDDFHKISEEPKKLCPKCGHETLQRGPGGGVGLIFKGSGFYKTEYAPTKAPELPMETSTKASGGGCCPCGKGSGSCSKE